MKLLSNQKAKVREIIQAIGLPEEEFSWENEDHQQGVCLTHKTTESQFRLQHQTGDIFDCYQSPGAAGHVEHFPRKRWNEIEKLIERWVRRVNQERRAAFRWDDEEEAEEGFPPETFLDDPDFYDDKPLSPVEIELIHQRLDAFETQVKDLFDLTEMQARVFSEEIRFSKEAAEKHGRRTWKRVFEGMLLNFGRQISRDLGRAAIKWGVPWINRFLSPDPDASPTSQRSGN